MNKGLKSLYEFGGNNHVILAVRTIGKKHYLDCLKIMETHLKAIDIIAKKGLPLIEIDMIKQSANYNEYNIKFSWCKMKNASVQKTEDEFTILKEVIDNAEN